MENRMSIDTATSQNQAVMSAIRGHHQQLADQLRALTAAALAATRTGPALAERDALAHWYRTELLPHAAAEESALYSRGADRDATRLLVRGMVDEHVALRALIEELGRAADPLDIATAAAAAYALFGVHLDKENDLLLPALDEAGIDLAAALEGMHEILGHAHDSGEPGDAAGGCGCGCGHDHDAPAGSGAVPVQLLSGPPEPQPAAGPGELDVRALPHGQRHDIIFARLDALLPGETLVIVNDHDPKPLRYQASALWPDKFEWTYREAGPQVWRIGITRASTDAD
jgi:uncharacterized protein (DUF2249 family)